jgi:hypothetical protein
MKCLKKSVLPEYIDNELSGKQLREVEAHLAICASCRGNLERMKADIDLVLENMEMLNPEHIPADILIPVPVGEKNTGARRISFPAFRWWDRRLAVAGSLLIFILGILVGTFFFSSPPLNISIRHESPEQLRFILQEHFENIKPVLIEYANFSVSQEDGMDILLDKEFVTALVEQNRFIKKRIPADKNEYLSRLLDELGLILQEISSLTKEDPASLSMIKEKEILFKLEASNPNSRDLLKI